MQKVLQTVCLLTATCKKRGVIETHNYQNMTKINKSTDLGNTTKQPCFLHDVMGSVYHWMISNLPYRIMYKHVWIDSQHKMWLPRCGWSKRQIADSEKRVKELAENIKWE
jgi:hypothetical protein